MMDNDREKELETLFEDHKALLKRVEKMIKEKGLPDTFVPVMKEQLEERAVAKALNILVREDDQDVEHMRAKSIRHFYDGLRKNGFNHRTALTIICGLDGNKPQKTRIQEMCEEEE